MILEATMDDGQTIFVKDESGLSKEKLQHYLDIETAKYKRLGKDKYKQDSRYLRYYNFENLEE